LLNSGGDSQFLLDRHQPLLGLGRLFQLSDMFQRLADGDFQVFEIDWLDQKVDGPAIHGRPDIGHVAVRGNHHRPQAFAGVPQFAQQRQSVHHRHVDIAQHEFDSGMAGERLQGLLSVVAEEKLEFLVADLAAESLANQQLQVRLIVHYQDLMR
jgi:hypothetical protein